MFVAWIRLNQRREKIYNKHFLLWHLQFLKTVRICFIKFKESTTANKYMTFSKRPLRDKVHTFSVSLKCCACRLWLESHLLIQKVLQHNPGTVVRRHWQRRKCGQHVWNGFQKEVPRPTRAKSSRVHERHSRRAGRQERTHICPSPRPGFCRI